MKIYKRYTALVVAALIGAAGIAHAGSAGIVEKMFVASGQGAVARTMTAKAQDTVSIKDFGAVPNDGIDDTAAVQAAINASSGSVLVPNGVYLVANIQMKSGLRLVGESQAAVLKLLDNATVATHNGSVADANGRYAANIIGSTLNHSGGAFYDNGVRARDEQNSSYIVENIIIENLTLDGNKANNQVGDVGLNASAMGAAVSIHQAKNVTVRNSRIINNRMDGVHVGYTLHGGSDYSVISGNYFEGNQRTNIALITGKYNSVIGNSGLAPTGGTGVNAGAGLDIEANFVGEVNYRHTVSGNRLGGVLGIVSLNQAKLQDTVLTGNVWGGGLVISGGEMTGGIVINGDSFIASSPTQNWMTRYGLNVSGTSERPTVIKNCTISGFARVMDGSVSGQSSNFVVEGSTISAQSFGTLVRGYKVLFKGNVFNFSGNADAATIDLSNTLGGTVPNQGGVAFVGNKFYGVSNPIFFRLSRDATWPIAANDFIFSANDVDLSGFSTSFSTSGSMTVTENRIKAFKPIAITTLSEFRFMRNDARAVAAENLFSGQSGTFVSSDISDNELKLVSINLSRPKDVTVARNSILDGNISISYGSTSAGIGRNHVVFNRLTATTVIANPFLVATGGGFLATDFVGNDQYKYNSYVGYTAGPSIAAGVSGKYSGTFD